MFNSKLKKVTKFFSDKPNTSSLKYAVKYSYQVTIPLVNDKDDFLKFKFPEYITARSQDLENF